MTNRRAIIIIPARYASSRFPGKPLALLGGRPIIRHVVERASRVGERVLVATDDQRIYDCVRDFGSEVVMTNPNHVSGTDRCLEAYRLVGRGEELLINLQGDEPFVLSSQIISLMEALRSTQADIATLAEPFAPDTPDDVLFSPNIVKLVRGNRGEALYFSRSVIPYLRGGGQGLCRQHQYYRHVGLYGFRTSILSALEALEPSILEVQESLEQLRWLSAGFRIQTETTHTATIGIDTPQDLVRAEEYLQQILPSAL